MRIDDIPGLQSRPQHAEYLPPLESRPVQIKTRVVHPELGDETRSAVSEKVSVSERSECFKCKYYLASLLCRASIFREDTRTSI